MIQAHESAQAHAYSPQGFRSFMLLGSVEAGKSTLLKALLGRAEAVRKTQAIEFEASCIDTPVEYFSHPRFYHALIQTSIDVGCLIYVHPANDLGCYLPPGLMDIYSDKELIAVISKTDLPDAQPDVVERILREQEGFHGKIFRTASNDDVSVAALRNYLLLSEEVTSNTSSSST